MHSTVIHLLIKDIHITIHFYYNYKNVNLNPHAIKLIVTYIMQCKYKGVQQNLCKAKLLSTHPHMISVQK